MSNSAHPPGRRGEVAPRKAGTTIALLLLAAAPLSPGATSRLHAQSPKPAVLTSEPVVLTSSDVIDGFYGPLPAAVRSAESWLGLYTEATESTLSRASVEISSVGSGDTPEYAVSVDPPDPVFLVSGVDALAPGPATTVIRWPAALSVDEAVPVGDADRLELVSSDPLLCDARVRLVSGSRSQLLHAPEDNLFACDEPHFEVLWAGDLDGDRRPDLLVDFSSKYSHHPRTLFLSTLAEDGELVGRAASYDRLAG